MLNNEEPYNCCGCCKNFIDGKCKIDGHEVDIYCGCETNYKSKINTTCRICGQNKELLKTLFINDICSECFRLCKGPY